MSHSQAPWKSFDDDPQPFIAQPFNKIDYGTFFCSRIMHPDGKGIVAFVPFWGSGPEQLEAEADRRLIAAAPELLAALKLALAKLRSVRVDNFTHRFGVSEVEEICAAAIAATEAR